MYTRDFDYHLPDELIAQQPLPNRTDSRLLLLDTDSRIHDLVFPDITQLLKADDLLVFNNTRVLAARLFGVKATGGKVEILIERLLNDNAALAHVRASKSPRAGTLLRVAGQFDIEVTGRQGSLFELRSTTNWHDILDTAGHMPLPPYITRADTSDDLQRYQTVYASQPGAVAAPTAGLHFDDSLLKALREQGVKTAEVTLHVGAGTFQPVRAEKIQDHDMHAEWLEVSEQVCEAVADCKAAGGRVIAVGTTSVRSLETAAASGTLHPYRGDSRLFISPGYPFHVVDAILTNFHLPQSTLLMLVSAFGGYQTMKQTYQHAVAQRYRFFSYGDAMFIEKPIHAI